MNKSNPVEFSKSPASEEGMRSACTLYVCTSCRPSGTARKPRENRPDFILYQKLQEAIKTSPLQDHVDVRPAECLSICPRPCGIALSSSEAWTYLFGDQQPNKTVHEIIDCVSIYLKSSNGFMSRVSRPKSLRSSILGRIPPSIGDQICI